MESRNFQLEAFAAAASPRASGSSSGASQLLLSPTADKENGGGNGLRGGGSNTLAVLADSLKVGPCMHRDCLASCWDAGHHSL